MIDMYVKNIIDTAKLYLDDCEESIKEEYLNKLKTEITNFCFIEKLKRR